jgi:hypothetical protein
VIQSLAKVNAGCEVIKDHRNRILPPIVTAKALQYRLATPVFKKSKSAFDQVAGEGEEPAYDEYANAILLHGYQSGCTATGDSGGPLYAVDKKFEGVYLLGVTTGSDVMEAKTVSKKVFRNDVSTSIAPYFNSIF